MYWLQAGIFLGVFSASYLGVRAFRSWSLRQAILDIPNERSSHAEPIPRGGGLVIAGLSLIAYAVLGAFFPLFFSWAYFFGALLIVVVSWLDDVRSVSFAGRLFVHLLAGVLLLADIGAFSEIAFPIVEADLSLGILGTFGTLVWIVGLINAYNFMDGIDGMAALQAVVAGLALSVVGFLLGLDGTATFSFIVAAASAGFLALNWHPARIFMGDVGSAYLGFTFAAMPLLGNHEDPRSARFLPFVIVVLFWCFLFDSVFSRLLRFRRGWKVWEPHREHLYQRIVSAGWTHSLVSGLYGLLATLLAATAIWSVYDGGRSAAALLICITVATLVLLILGLRKKV